MNKHHKHDPHFDVGFFGKIIKFFKNTFSTSGEFDVTGEGSITIEVKCNNPKKIFVCFADPEPTPIPCVPFVPDTLSVQFNKRPGPFSDITISWNVASIRKIAWCIRNH